jgi:integrase
MTCHQNRRHDTSPGFGLFSWHRAACSTNAALDLQCRSPRSTSRKEPGDSPELAEIREAKDPSVVRNRGPRASRRHAGALPSHGHHPSDLGLRVAELLALRVQDVDFLRRTVRVEFQTTPDGKYRVPPKTPRSRRIVPLPEVVGKRHSRRIAGFRRRMTAHSSPRPRKPVPAGALRRADPCSSCEEG